MYIHLPVDIHGEKDLLNTVAILAAFFLAPFIPLPPLSSFRLTLPLRQTARKLI